MLFINELDIAGKVEAVREFFQCRTRLCACPNEKFPPLQDFRKIKRAHELDRRGKVKNSDVEQMQTVLCVLSNALHLNSLDCPYIKRAGGRGGGERYMYPHHLKRRLEVRPRHFRPLYADD